MRTYPIRDLFLRFQVFLAIACLVLHSFASAQNISPYPNWESAPVHPLDVNADGSLLALAHLPTASLQLFSTTEPQPRPIWSTQVGLDPVTARFRNARELWIVNHISDSITILDALDRRILAIVPTLDAPCDVVFAGVPERAYVSSATTDTIEVFDPDARNRVQTIRLAGSRPKAMAVSPDKSRVYVAIAESGNATTLLAGPLVKTDHPNPASVLDLASSPHAGVNPPPNSDTILLPPIAPANATSPPPVSLIVKRDAQRRWRDDSGADWTEFIRGTNAPLTGRRIGWDMPDNDLAVIQTSDHSVSYARSLMNANLALAVHPTSGSPTVVGTDAKNEIRFEPRLRGIFSTIVVASVDPSSLLAQLSDLNPHLDYKTHTIPLEKRRLSIGDPRAIVWSPSGDLAWIAGMGSANIIAINPQGQRFGDPIALGEFAGPAGLAHHPTRPHLYIYERFASKLSLLNTQSRRIESSLALHDPTPPAIRKGRRHLYDTHKTSGLGQASCASCHIDARFDRLAWDLGAPDGKIKPLPESLNFLGSVRPKIPFHPMKGPMMTQTLQDIIGHEPFHWRGDRDGIEEFNATFEDLQGADAPLTAPEMQEFKDFLATIQFPPNRFRNLNNSLPMALPLDGIPATGRGNESPGGPLPPGNAVRGLAAFQAGGSQSCAACHSLPTGLGPTLQFVNNRWSPVPPSTNGAARVALISLARVNQLPFRVASLRNLDEKLHFNKNTLSSQSGFGFMHDGSVDSLSRFLLDGFDKRSDQEVADLVAFLLAFTGSDLPQGIATRADRPIGPNSADTHAAVGRQLLISNHRELSPQIAQDLQTLLAAAGLAPNRVELTASLLNFNNSPPKHWLFEPSRSHFVPDLASENPRSLETLLELASPSTPLVFTAVAAGSGRRLALDWDLDGALNRDESQQNSDPRDAASTPESVRPQWTHVALSSNAIRLAWNPRTSGAFAIDFTATLSSPNWTEIRQLPQSASEIELPLPADLPPSFGFYRIRWSPSTFPSTKPSNQPLSVPLSSQNSLPALSQTPAPLPAPSTLTPSSLSKLPTLQSPAVTKGSSIRARNAQLLSPPAPSETRRNLRNVQWGRTNLANANLAEVDLTRATMTNANFTGADLSGALLWETRFNASQFTQARLVGADLRSASGLQANFSRADLTGANLAGADLSGAQFTQAKIAIGDLSDATLTLADLTSADLRGASLAGARLSFARLHNASINTLTTLDPAAQAVHRIQSQKGQGAVFTNLNLSLSDLANTDLTEANLSRADLSGSDLSGAILRGATFVGAQLRFVQWNRSLIDDRTRLPAKDALAWEIVNQPLANRPLNRRDLSSLNLFSAQLNQASLISANFAQSILIGVSFRGANLRGANFSNADLTGADFTGADITGANFVNVVLDGTILPDGTIVP